MTTKIGFKQLLRNQALWPVFDNYLRRCQHVGFEGSRFLIVYVMSCLERGLPVPDLSMAQGGFMRQFFAGVLAQTRNNLVTRRQKGNVDINLVANDWYSVARTPDTPWTDPTRLSNAIT